METPKIPGRSPLGLMTTALGCRGGLQSPRHPASTRRRTSPASTRGQRWFGVTAAPGKGQHGGSPSAGGTRACGCVGSGGSSSVTPASPPCFAHLYFGRLHFHP